ncbi:MAG TPA: DUF2219 family protein [Leptospiraceae bacterium]|nr:lipid A deacylase LpxR family protein [Leptospirales bacterium]HMW58947.1 DUF2219 family protein [Leptospiraceae bacterium]HMX56198.1 DUF2219 family protein [Leptospiraceae bacterium]HMZ36199.1 DUF2219 family protein [Leptospiraceae bacterium]HNJ33251.1 DUF2219 family protein [Leptospiraceae bacterium]
MRVTQRLLLTVIALAADTSLRGEIPLEPITRPFPYVGRFSWDNDAPLGSDREYTSGLRLDAGSYDFLYLPPSFLLHALTSITDSPGGEYSGISASQFMFTPKNLIRSDIAYGERPYSGVAQASMLSAMWWENTAISTEIGAGEIGPKSQAGSSQRKFHQVIRSTLPEGWGNQIPTQKFFQWNSNIKYSISSFMAIDLTGRVGGLDSSVSAGPLFRFGSAPNTPAQGTAIYDDPSPLAPPAESETYVYIEPSIKYQGRNGTLAGGSRGLSTSDLRTLVSNVSPNSIIASPLYGQISNEHTGSDIRRFVAFQTAVNQEPSIGWNYLIFNSIFNGGPTIDRDVRDAILRDILTSGMNAADYPLAPFFAYDTLFRKPQKPQSVLTKYLAYVYLFQGRPLSAENLVAATALLWNERDGSRRYAVQPRHVQGRFSIGMVFNRPGWFLQAGATISSLEYHSDSGVTPFHRYATLQFGTRF